MNANQGGLGRDLLGCAIGYLAGSLPVGVWLGRASHRVDVRDHGSGGSGMTNVLRTLGPRTAAAVLALDIAKGSVAVGGAKLLGASGGGQAAAGLAAVAGHSWPVFARFRGGKGVSTAFGGALVLAPEAGVAAVLGGLTAVATTRIVSIGSLLGTASAAAGALWGVSRHGRRRVPGLVLVGGSAAIIGLRHGANVRRLAKGQEPQMSLRSAPRAAPGGR